MLIRLILLFTIIPLVELALLIKIGGIIGLLPTIIIVILTGILGAALTRSQGIKTLNNIRNELNRGSIPKENLLNGVLILAGGIVLLTPGLLTDLFGFLLLIPPTREIFKKLLKEKLKEHIERNTTYTSITIN
ncbi:MAG: FxsA family protein [Candidatus Dadabacteria bacterium]|nr:FxsA family protein [Candidatus Dadabacteria bacterium]NIQ14398.1 FxsA family protein [Candidatus Dadabacteria bacterium]